MSAIDVENTSRWARRAAVVLGVNALVSGVGVVMSVVQTFVCRRGVDGAIVFMNWTSEVFTVAPRLLPPDSRELRDFPASRVARSHGGVLAKSLVLTALDLAAARPRRPRGLPHRRSAPRTPPCVRRLRRNSLKKDFL